MSEIEKIRKTISLQEEKESLERKLLSINKDIELNQRECSHVGVYIGDCKDGNDCKCVLCNSNLSNDQMMDLASKGLIIYAHNYLTHSNPKYMEKFDTIQTIYLGLCRENSFTSNKEIVGIFQEIINRSLDPVVEGKETESQLKVTGLVKVLKKDE